MPRRNEPQAHIGEVDFPLEFDRCEMIQSAFRVLFGVQRQRGPVPGKSAAVCVFGLFLLQPPGVGQEDAAQLVGRLAAMDLAGEAVLH
jgi:hypothetical protein